TIENEAHIDEGLITSLYNNREEDVDQTANNKLTEFFDGIIGYSLEQQVSDIHFEKRASKSQIRMRRHGELLFYKSLDPKYTMDLCTVIYNVLAESESKDINFNADDYQAAAINRIVNNIEVKLRYQSLPTYPGGFDVVLRVLPIGSDDEKYTPLSKLGYSPSQEKALLNIIAKPVGALIIAGTTGSGKSTTLKNLLMFTNLARGLKCKIYTIEDPPEYKIPHVSQIPVRRMKADENSTKSPFHAPLVAAMRGDPDILMIGEIRDGFTGDGLKKATQSGHQVMTTIHASSALGIIERLADFGIKPSVMGSPEFLTGLIYQKLIPIICPHCSTPFNEILEGMKVDSKAVELNKRLEDVADLSKDNIRVRGNGCSHCNNLGVIGRTVCAEIISPDFTMLKYFREEDAIGAYEYWRGLSDGLRDSENMTGKTVLEHAISKMRKGIVCPKDIEEAFGPINGAIMMLEQMRSDKRQKMLGDDHKKASRIGDSVNDNESIMNKVSTEAEENASSLKEIQQGGWVDFD
ncbi:Flp pilus assembly complex ATPase component, partial [Escherichia coli]|nr:Flp pilus assembly complex ATPase component [Escherichia coli]